MSGKTARGRRRSERGLEPVFVPDFPIAALRGGPPEREKPMTPSERALFERRMSNPLVQQAMSQPISVWQPTEPVTEAEGHETAVLMGLARNIKTTGHPFHHLTVSGVIVDDDPTLRYHIKELERTAKPATPIDRNWYGVNPYPDV